MPNLFPRRLIPALGEYEAVRSEVPLGSDGKTRIDFALDRAGGRVCFVEVKSVTLALTRAGQLPSAAGGKGLVAAFPDTVSERAQKHVRELEAQASSRPRDVEPGTPGSLPEPVRRRSERDTRPPAYF